MMTTSDIRALTDCYVRQWGERVPAFADDSGEYIYDGVAGHFTRCHSLTLRQRQYVRAASRRSGRLAAALAHIHATDEPDDDGPYDPTRAGGLFERLEDEK